MSFVDKTIEVAADVRAGHALWAAFREIVEAPS